MNQRQAVIQEALTWLRTPFHHQAAIKGVGVGCGTLLIEVYRAVGIDTPSIEECGFFSRDWHMHTTHERYVEILEKFSRLVDHPQSGDIALFKIGKVYGHSAVVTSWPQVIHVMWGRTVELADASKAPLQDRPVLFLSPFKV